MNTNLKIIVSDLFDSNIKNISEVDNHDLVNLVRGYLRDECYDIYEILEVIQNDNIISEFESLHHVNLLNDYPYKKLFPHYKKREALVCITQLFSEFVCNYPGDIYSKFTIDFCKIFSQDIDSVFDQVICDEYGRNNYRTYEDFEYSVYCRTGQLLGSQ